MYCILTRIVDKWNRHKNENPPSWEAWWAYTSFGIIGRHIHGFSHFDPEKKHDIMFRLSFFRNELEKKFSLEKIRDSDYAQKLYEKHSSYFSK